MYGLDDPKRTRLTASVFNGRKICGVFTPGGWLGGGQQQQQQPQQQPQQQQQQQQQPVHGTILLPLFFKHVFAQLLRAAGPGGDEVPAIWVDRMGAKVGVTEQYSRSSKGTLALLAQVRGGNGGPCLLQGLPGWQAAYCRRCRPPPASVHAMAHGGLTCGG
jgi:hypothetical protein